MQKNFLEKVSYFLVLLGGLNWGCVALGFYFSSDIFTLITFGNLPAQIILSAAIGVASLYLIWKSFSVNK